MQSFRRWDALMLLAAVGLAGCKGEVAAKPSTAPPKVTVAHPLYRQLVDEEEFNGWTEASETVEVRARVRGHIKEVHFEDGGRVEKGQLLFELDPDPFQVKIDQTKAQARAFEAQKEASEKDVARYTELVKSGGATKQQLEKATADAQAYEAQILAKLEEVKRDELDLNYSRVTAPIAGRISRALLTAGNLVNAGGSDPLLTTIVATDRVYIYFAVDERTLQKHLKRAKATKTANIREQQTPFRFGLDSDQGYPHEGLLDFADNRIDSATGTILVRGVASNESGMLTPGSRVRVRFAASDPYMALVVPDMAVNTEQERKYLLVVDQNKEVKRRSVELGRLLDDGMRVVTASTPELKVDDLVIVEGMQRARLNYPVDPIEEAPTTSTASPSEVSTQN